MDNSETDKNDKSPLLKPKKPRPPPSEKQMDNFRKMAEKRAENIAKKKEDKIIQAKRDLLEKEGYVKKDITKETPKEKEPLDEMKEFIITDEELEKLERELTPNKVKKVLKSKTVQPLPLDKIENKKPTLPVKDKKIKQKVIQVEPSSSESEDEDCDSSSSEEIVIIKRTKKTKAPKKTKQVKQHIEEEDNEYVEEIKPQPNYINYFL